MPNMQQHNMRYAQQPVFWMNQHEQPIILTHSTMRPPPPPPLPAFPDFRKKRRKDGTCTYLVIVFLLVILALAGVGLGTYRILQLQKELDVIKEYSSDAQVSPPASSAKLTGLEKLPEKKEGRLAAHVTGKDSKNLPLNWEERIGRAFTAGIQYRNRGLIVNKTGLHFLYSSIYFRGKDCLKQELMHIVYKKSLRYRGEIKLMEDKEDYICSPRAMWGRHSYLGAVFNLTSYDELYVNVSNVNLVSFDETKTFFGLYKLGY